MENESVVGRYRIPSMTRGVYEVFARDGRVYARTHPQGFEFEMLQPDLEDMTPWPQEGDRVLHEGAEGVIVHVEHEFVGDDVVPDYPVELTVRVGTELFNAGSLSVHPLEWRNELD